MIPTFLDLKTGKTAKGDDQSFYWWTEGNGSCDCSRVIAFEEKDVEEIYTSGGYQDTCLGCRRFLAIDVEGELNSYDHEGKNPQPVTKEPVLKAMNSEYLHRLERP